MGEEVFQFDAFEVPVMGTHRPMIGGVDQRQRVVMLLEVQQTILIQQLDIKVA